jgi:toxin ParE1/3/4
VSTVAWTTDARADLASIDDYYAARDPDFAARVGRTAIAAADFLLGFPEAGEEIAPDHRRWHVKQTPYVLVYRSVLQGIQVLRVFHERQNYRSQLP